MRLAVTRMTEGLLLPPVAIADDERVAQGHRVVAFLHAADRGVVRGHMRGARRLHDDVRCAVVMNADGASNVDRSSIRRCRGNRQATASALCIFLFKIN